MDTETATHSSISRGVEYPRIAVIGLHFLCHTRERTLSIEVEKMGRGVRSVRRVREESCCVGSEYTTLMRISVVVRILVSRAR